MRGVIVVGAGRWARQGWAPLLVEQAPRFRPVAVVDPDADAAREMAQLLGGEAEVRPSLPDALAHHGDAEVGIVLSPPATHATVITALVDAGLHVLSEKPLATTAEDLGEIVDAVRRQGVKAAVMQNYRSQHRIRVAHQVLREGTLGPIRYLVARFAADYRTPGSWVGDKADPLLDTAIHHVDVLRYLADAPIVDVAAVTANPEPEVFGADCVAGMLLRFEGGTFGLYEVSLLAAGTENRWRDVHYRVECRDGAVECDGPEVRVLRYGHVDTLHAPDRDVVDGHRHQLQSFADWLDGGPPVPTTMEDNRHVVTPLLTALKAAPVDWSG